MCWCLWLWHITNGIQRNATNAQIWGKYERLALWWQLYVTSLLEQDLRQFQAAWFFGQSVPQCTTAVSLWMRCSTYPQSSYIMNWNKSKFIFSRTQLPMIMPECRQQGHFKSMGEIIEEFKRKFHRCSLQKYIQHKIWGSCHGDYEDYQILGHCILVW